MKSAVSLACALLHIASLQSDGTCYDSPYISHESDPAKYYKCVEGSPVLLQCARGYVFSENMEKCVTVKRSKEGADKNVSDKNSCLGNGHNGHGNNGCGSNNWNNGSGSSETSEELSESQESSNETFESNESNSKDETEIPNETESPNITNEPITTEMPEVSHHPEETTNNPTVSTTNTPELTTEETKVAEVPTEVPVVDKCPLQNPEYVIFYPHEDCAKYYVCDWGKLIEMNCPSGLHFNPSLEVCDYPSAACM